MSDLKGKQSMQCYQSVWMARWTHTSCSDSLQGQNGLSLSLSSSGDGDVKKYAEVTDTRTIRIMNEDVAAARNLDRETLPLFNLENFLGNLPHGRVSRPQLDFNLEKDCSLGPEFRDGVFRSEMILYGSDKGKAPQISVADRQERVKPTSLDPDLGNLSIVGRLKSCDEGAMKFRNSVMRQDINKSKQEDGIEYLSNIAKSNRNSIGQLLSLSPYSSNKSVKIQLLDSSSGSQGKGDVREFLNPEIRQRNETSAETATINTETFWKQNYLSGVNSATTNKNKTLQLLPDMNETPIDPAPENPEPSSSKTQSLDTGLVLTSQLPKYPQTPQPTTVLEPSTRWLKRLKLSVSHSFGTERSNLEEPLSHEKANKSKNRGFFEFETVESSKKDCDDLLSQNWIKRWCKNGVAQKKKLESVVICDPRCTKLDFDEVKKEFPSIGAMALMGKAMNGFQQCEIRKRGSFVVWDTKKP